MTPRRPGGGLPGRAAADWFAFGCVTAAYLAVTVGESILAPVFPTVAGELGFDLRLAGLAFGVLTGSIAVGNFAGGYLLARAGVRAALLVSLVLAGGGAVVTAASGDRTGLLAGQTLVGLGAGVYFPPGLNAAGLLAGAQRRGLAMGIFGVAFSGGLTIAALLAAAGARIGWRTAFWVAASLCVVGAVAVLVSRLPRRPPRPAAGAGRPLRDALGVPVLVGGIGAVSQYGTVAFLPTFAVASWGYSPAAAALLIASARVLSVPAKLVAGAAADRFGSHGAVWGLAVLLVATGAWWTLVPAPAVALVAAVVFAAAVSALFPVANLLALQEFGDRGPLLGTYRSAQIAMGAAGAYLIGVVSTAIGLGPTLIASALLPALLLLLVPRRVAAPSLVAQAGS